MGGNHLAGSGLGLGGNLLAGSGRGLGGNFLAGSGPGLGVFCSAGGGSNTLDASEVGGYYITTYSPFLSRAIHIIRSTLST